MRNPKRAAIRLAVIGWLGLASLSLVGASSVAAAPPEKVLPDSAVFFGKINNATAFREAFKQSQVGQLWADPAMNPLKEDIKSKLADTNGTLKEKIGVSILELIEIPQGTISVSVLAKDNADVPAALVLTLDAGKNADKLADILTKAAAEGEKSGAKVSKESFKSLSITVVQPPKPKDAKEGDTTPPPAGWTRDGSNFYISSDVDSLKDVLANTAGRETSLASNETFSAAQKKLGVEAPVFWFADINRLMDLIGKAGSKGKNAANIEQFKGVAQLLGINGLKAASGTLAWNSGSYDSVTKTFVVAPAPLSGLLKLFPLPKVNLRPEPWVPASIASYQTYSWNLDDAFVALNDLANMFQPGVLNVLEQQLVGPNGGEPLNFKKDVFDPLGDRITLVSDFKKPITEDSQRMLLGIALEDAAGFQNTLKKLIELAGGAPKKREFQGTSIYDFDLPELPNNGGVNAPAFKGPISVAVAKNTLFVATESSLLEQVLRGGPGLADSPGFQAVAKEIPSQTSSLTYVKPEESARVSYEMIKSGQFEKALAGAAVAGGPDMSRIGRLINKDKLPDFSIFAKYLSAAGGYAVLEDDGLTITNFALRKSNP